MSTLNKIVVCGGGLASHFCIAALVHALPKEIELIFIETSDAAQTDIFYGTVTSPSTYKFLLNLGLTEPDFLPLTNTAFSLGTRYKDWGPQKRHWTQSFHHPLPVFNGVGFHHYLTRLRQSAPELAEFEPYIMSVQAADKGAFAHPPEVRNTPLADMDYGYHFVPDQWREFFSDRLDPKRVTRIRGEIASVQRENDIVKTVTLADGQIIEAAFFIDATGSDAAFTHPHTAAWVGKRKLRAVTTHHAGDTSDVCRTLTATDYGWQSETPLQDGRQRLTIYDQASENTALKDHDSADSPSIDIKVGRSVSPWIGNCLTIGHGAAALEPLTPAPMMLLQRDIERLIELVPVSENMTVESREYNRQFTDDYSHAKLFHRAFFTNVDDTPYWAAASAEPVSDKLNMKLEQFENRGVFTQFDYEPFDEQDWAMMHFGIGRLPARYDPLVDRAPEAALKTRLVQMRGAIKMMAEKLPPHEVYMTRLLQYLKEQHG